VKWRQVEHLDLGQMGAGRAGLLARPAPLGPLGSPPLRPRGLAGPSEDGGRCEFEESLPSRRSSSTTRVCSVAISRACSALDGRNSGDHCSLDRNGGFQIGVGGKRSQPPRQRAVKPAAHGPQRHSYTSSHPTINLTATP